MPQINPLLKCHSLNLLDQYIGETEKCYLFIGKWGGRRYTNAAHNIQFSFSLNQLVSQLLTLAENPAENASMIRKLIRNIRRLDALPAPHVSILRRLLTAVRRFFGNFFFNRNAMLKELEQKLPAPQPAKKAPPLAPIIPQAPVLTVVVKEAEAPKEPEPIVFQKAPEPVVVPLPQKPLKPSLAVHPELRNWLNNPVEGLKTNRFFMNFKEVIASPDNKFTVEGLFMQCGENDEIDLNSPHSLLLIEGIFSHCIIDRIVTNYTKSKQIGIMDWLCNQPTFSYKTLNAAIVGHLAHKKPDFTTLLNLIKCIQKRNMKELPDSLGKVLAKMVQLDASSNPFEREFAYLLQEKLIKESDYQLILDEFRIKRGDPKKADCNWQILTWLQERSRQEGWK